MTGAVKGALIASGAGPAAHAAGAFVSGIIGSALEQKISGGSVSVRKSITSGLTNAVSDAVYGNSAQSSRRKFSLVDMLQKKYGGIIIK